jgi:hypothetical protein
MIDPVATVNNTGGPKWFAAFLGGIALSASATFGVVEYVRVNPLEKEVGGLKKDVEELTKLLAASNTSLQEGNELLRKVPSQKDVQALSASLGECRKAVEQWRVHSESLSVRTNLKDELVALQERHRTASERIINFSAGGCGPFSGRTDCELSAKQAVAFTASGSVARPTSRHARSIDLPKVVVDVERCPDPCDRR